MALSRTIALFAALTVGSSGVPALAETLVEKGMIRFQVGETNGAYAEILLKPRLNARHVISLKLIRAAKPGAHVSLKVDAAPSPVFATQLRPEQCTVELGASTCTVVVPGHGPQAEAIVGAFRAGRLVQVDVMDGSSAMLHSSASLMGFSAAFRRITRS